MIYTAKAEAVGGKWEPRDEGTSYEHKSPSTWKAFFSYFLLLYIWLVFFPSCSCSVSPGDNTQPPPTSVYTALRKNKSISDSFFFSFLHRRIKNKKKKTGGGRRAVALLRCCFFFYRLPRAGDNLRSSPRDFSFAFRLGQTEKRKKKMFVKEEETKTFWGKGEEGDLFSRRMR